MPILRKDQKLAVWAYAKARSAADLDDYEIAVQTFGATLLRSGLEVAVAVLERNPDRKSYKKLLEDLAGETITGIPAAGHGQQARNSGGGQRDSWTGGSRPPAASWPDRVRNIPEVVDYALAWREVRDHITWLRRACRALRAERPSDEQPAERGASDANRTP
jgi:hypothetical protein